jgi:hypothetical protein
MPPRSRTLPGLLDSLIILIVACMMMLILLWISTQIRGLDLFSKLPDWLTYVAQSVWTYVTGAASSTLLALLRGRSNEPKPNYLLWIFGTVVALLGMVGALVALIPPPRQLPPDALLRFWLKSDANDKPRLSFRALAPDKWWYDMLAVADQGDGHYQQTVRFPDQNSRFYGRVVRAPLVPQGNSQPNPPTSVCFRKNPSPPHSGAPFEVQMDCPEGKRCSLNADDPGWARGCSEESDWNLTGTQIGGILPLVYADAQKPDVGWKVPSLETLRAMADAEKIGYTDFTITSTQLSALKDAEGFQYLIKANGSPLYVDGWGAEDMVKPFHAAKGFTFSFGLPNLSFSGGEDGCENIEVDLEFRQKERMIKKVVISRKYAALRDADSDEVRTADGTMFTWGGTYKKPAHEDRMEVFVLSTSDLREARRWKAKLEADKLSYQGTDVVGVLRPRLDNPNYGVVVGLRQPTMQIRFTYDVNFAQKLHEWVKKEHAQNNSLFRKDTFLYQMRPDESGTGKYKSCNAAAIAKP